mmetsp:Transcript_28222/g.72229  ORF Transcript_28222/g.72229 Transcript_28222/m.72229 type:complete len:325 (-) Transcript_28222:1137-2111(-)
MTALTDITLNLGISQFVPRNASLVVIGAHHFGGDQNDPIYSAVKDVAWSNVLLVEASPFIAAQLRARVEAINPTPHVLPGHVRVVNQGVCPSEEDQTLPFYTFLGARHLPFWATQIGSFRRQHVEKHLPLLAATTNHSVEALRELIAVDLVTCTSLLSLLKRQRIDRLAALLIDTEGLDCDLVASQQWSSRQWCSSLRPTILVFEWKHCSPMAYASATSALELQSTCRAVESGNALPFRRIAETWENVFFTRAQRLHFENGDAERLPDRQGVGEAERIFPFTQAKASAQRVPEGFVRHGGGGLPNFPEARGGGRAPRRIATHDV